ncbi:uncharacterized protein LOC118418505 isoform X2 [Branchiostoma floridae]|uniref:Uncharacterized protein LOC118418505 isoform X1 n=1 Tax=Branchiostoma floridae TaxID=7739 RepID=A0A9J7LCK1_BRAFL|nr:uncharacterized protein LOC118418505 isoform X1 [Branchiostoma floridae]XP_035680363.1 uncharacterized protein LOC118418505 isoform X2 [Branchiostoma floridae]
MSQERLTPVVSEPAAFCPPITFGGKIAYKILSRQAHQSYLCRFPQRAHRLTCRRLQHERDDMERTDSLPRSASYSGSRAEWIAKRADDFDAKARSFLCGRCGHQAAWVCLDPVCVSYNRERVLCLCDNCDKLFHPPTSPVMHSHRRLGVALYVSMLMLHRYQKVIGVMMTRSPNHSRPSTPVSTDESEITSSQSPTASRQTRPARSPARPSSSSPVSSRPASPDSTVNIRKRRRSGDDTSEATAKVSRTDTDRSGHFCLAADLRPIHDSYGRILDRLRQDRSLSVSEGCRHEPFGKLTLRNYAAIAELRIVDSDLYTSALHSYIRRGDGSGTLSGFERECRQVLSGHVRQVSVMRERRELLPRFDNSS